MERIKVLHEDVKLIHNDIKLENIVVGHKDSDLIYLIDFGLASSYLNSDNTHKKK